MAGRATRNKQQELCGLLRDIREEAGLRQVDLAARLGVPQSFVSKYETGERVLDLLEVESVCDAAGVALTEFIQRYVEGGT